MPTARSRRRTEDRSTEIISEARARMVRVRCDPEKTGILFGRVRRTFRKQTGVVDVELPTSPAPGLFSDRLTFDGNASSKHCALPLPLAGEGWGGGNVMEDAPTRPTSLVDLPRKRERLSVARCSPVQDWTVVPLLRRLRVALHRRAGADEVTVAVGIVDPSDRAPVFVRPRGAGREAALGAAVGP
jgi:hypothetical protein